MKSSGIKIRTHHFLKNGNQEIITDIYKGNFCDVPEARAMEMVEGQMESGRRELVFTVFFFF